MLGELEILTISTVNVSDEPHCVDTDCMYQCSSGQRKHDNTCISTLVAHDASLTDRDTIQGAASHY